LDKEIMVEIFLAGIQANDETILTEYFTGVENIILNSSISGPQMKIWLAGLSVGRASINYWYDYELGNR
jgi:hypothetical protein